MKPVQIALAVLVLAIAISTVLLFRLTRPSPIPGPEEKTPLTTADAPVQEMALPSSIAPSGLQKKATAEGVQKWDTRINELLTDRDITNDEAAHQLMEVARNPEAPDDQRLDALEHGLNLLGDEDYEREIVALVQSAPTADQLESVIFSLHGRKGRAQLQTALAIARHDTTPISDDAFELMAFLVNPVDDLGTDWEKWQQAVDAHLAERQ